MGFPIRKSTDQRVFAPPRSLSQRITSFIACACQGIHQLPLRHLIVLIANAHPGQAPNGIGTKRPASRDLSRGAVRQPIMCGRLSVSPRQTKAIDAQPAECRNNREPHSSQGVRTNLLFTMSYRTRGSGLNLPRNLNTNDADALLSTPPSKEGMVEPDGIEPTTPCLQSRCSPS